jgi:hypothetical protein
MKIRLTESKLKQIVEESVKNVLTELDWKTYANAAKKRYAQAMENPASAEGRKAWDSSYELNRMANDRFRNDHVGNMQYDTLGDKLRKKKSPKFTSNFDVRNSNFPSQAMKGSNKSGNEIFNTKRGSYYDNRAVGGGYVEPNNFFRDKEVGERFKAASDELWDYADGNYEYQKGKSWNKK